MTILLVSFIDNNQCTGMGRWSHQIALGLKELGNDCDLWFADDFPRVKTLGRLAVILFPVVLAFRLLRNRKRYDAVVIHEPSGFWYGLCRHWRSTLPLLILMCHNVESHCFADLKAAHKQGFAWIPGGTRLKTPLFRLWQSDGAIRRADHVVCLSSYDQNYLYRNLRCPAERVTWVANGVSGEFFQERRQRLPLRRVLFVGGWLDVKGRRVLPLIWAEVISRISDAQLTLVGTGISRDEVLGDFEPEHRDSITVISRIDSPGGMPDYFQDHDLLLIPSLSEGSPLALLEAMAAAMPIVASSVGGIPDVLEHGKEGLLFTSMNITEAADQVCRLMASPLLAYQLGAEAQKRARKLTWQSTAAGMLNAIQHS